MSCTISELLDQALEDDRLSKTDVRVLKRVYPALDAHVFRAVKPDGTARQLRKTRQLIALALLKTAEIGYLVRGEPIGQGVYTYRLPHQLPEKVQIPFAPKSRVRFRGF